ncbi:MAG: hypothetical protein K9I69_03185 [Ignavibacteriales bacterium]|nr:hypothetical protein [Ignavibacteriales bacterium]MCF8306650.1 hypothetical protein [Ignavibacteriales bacterium]MCF8316250.1 hypothetical protein [Ignavibacteriales bacterium]MCF8437834.1 hypothetical protein [Ignavibacteriales bacterium]
MDGDKINLNEEYLGTARAIIKFILEDVLASEKKMVIAVAGESGSGKTITANALSMLFENMGQKSIVFSQDDYFILPPYSNDIKRREDCSWVGPGEVRLDLLDSHIGSFLQGENNITKPLINYHENQIYNIATDLKGFEILIVEGTYVSLLKKPSLRIFIDRNYHDTYENRLKRARAIHELDPFIDSVLELEHQIINSHRMLADILIDRDYTVRDVRNKIC